MTSRVGFRPGTTRAVRTTRTALELHLTDNGLTRAREFKGQPKKAAEFFNQSLLEDPSRDADEAPAKAD